MRILLSLFSLTLCACSSTPSAEEQEEQLAEATDTCLSNPALARAWGECNVKSVIFQRAEAIGHCQAKHSPAKGETMMLKIRLLTNGKVKRVWAEDGGTRNKKLEACLAGEISKLQFARPPKGVDPVIYFPFQP